MLYICSVTFTDAYFTLLLIRWGKIYSVIRFIKLNCFYIAVQARIQKIFPGGVQPWRITVEVHKYEK